MEIKKSVLIITILYLLSSIAISFVYKVKYNKLNNEYNKVINKKIVLYITLKQNL